MHELYHNLGLRHNGNQNNPNDSPDYVSIMSYNYQLHPDRWPDGIDHPGGFQWGGGYPDSPINWHDRPNYGNRYDAAHTVIQFNDWANIDYDGFNDR